MGATCCYCGLSGKAGLLPALQPLNEPSTLTGSHMVLRPLGHRLPACLPALLSVDLSIIHLSGFGTRGHPHSMQIAQPDCHWDTADSPMCLWQEAENQADVTTRLPSLQVDRLLLLYFLPPLG